MLKRFLLNWQISVCLIFGSLAEIQLGYSWSSFISSFSYRLGIVWLHNQNYGGLFHTDPLYVLWILCVWIFSYFQKASVYDLADAQIFSIPCQCADCYILIFIVLNREVADPMEFSWNSWCFFSFFFLPQHFMLENNNLSEILWISKASGASILV